MLWIIYGSMVIEKCKWFEKLGNNKLEHNNTCHMIKMNGPIPPIILHSTWEERSLV